MKHGRLIDADALKEYFFRPYYNEESNSNIDIGHIIDDQPTVNSSAQPERKRGEWTDDNACPFCGFHPWYERDIHTLSFCPNCGARMEV